MHLSLVNNKEKNKTVKEKNCLCFNIGATRTKWSQSILKIVFEFVLTEMT